MLLHHVHHCVILFWQASQFAWFANLLFRGRHDIARSGGLIQPKQSKKIAAFADNFAVGSTLLMIFLKFRIVQNCSDVSHASSWAGNGGKWLLHCFFQGTRKWKMGSKRKGNRGKHEFLKKKCNQVDVPTPDCVGLPFSFAFLSLLLLLHLLMKTWCWIGHMRCLQNLQKQSFGFVDQLWLCWLHCSRFWNSESNLCLPVIACWKKCMWRSVFPKQMWSSVCTSLLLTMTLIEFLSKNHDVVQIKLCKFAWKTNLVCRFGKSPASVSFDMHLLFFALMSFQKPIWQKLDFQIAKFAIDCCSIVCDNWCCTDVHLLTAAVANDWSICTFPTLQSLLLNCWVEHAWKKSISLDRSWAAFQF